MSQVKKQSTSSTLFLSVLLLILIFLFSLSACSPTQRDGIVQIGQAVSKQVDTALEEPSELVFAGQVEDENGRWLNDCVIILFKDGEEVVRTTSRLMESAFSDNGPMDGVFELRIPNTYKLTLAHEFYVTDTSLMEMKTVPGMVGMRSLGTWFSDLNPNDLRVLNVPDKQVEYALVVLSMPLSELPDSYASGNLAFQNGMLVIEAEQAGGRGGAEATAVETATPVVQLIPVPTQTNIQFTLLPSRNNGLDWHWQMSGYFGNRWDVWERFVAPRNPGMDWNTFEYAVLAHNPQLETDGFVFYPEKSYLLPLNH